MTLLEPENASEKLAGLIHCRVRTKNGSTVGDGWWNGKTILVWSPYWSQPIHWSLDQVVFRVKAVSAPMPERPHLGDVMVANGKVDGCGWNYDGQVSWKTVTSDHESEWYDGIGCPLRLMRLLG